jgi:hypothetical protein
MGDYVKISPETILVPIVLFHPFILGLPVDWMLHDSQLSRHDIAMLITSGALKPDMSRLVVGVLLIVSSPFLGILVKSLSSSPNGILFLILTLGYLASVIVSGLEVGRDGLDTVGYVARYLTTMALGGCLMQAFKRGSLSDLALVANILSICFSSYYLIVHGADFVDQDISGNERIYFGSAGADAFGTMIEAFILFTIFCYALDRDCFVGLFRSLTSIIATTVGLLLVTLTFGRGSIVGLAVSFALFGFAALDARKRLVYGCACGVVAICAVIWFFGTSDHSILVRNPGDDLTTGRLEIWTSAISSWNARTDQLLLGMVLQGGAHNTLIGIAASYGLIAFAFFFLVQLSYFVCAATQAKSELRYRIGTTAVLTGAFVVGLFDNVMYINISPLSYLYYGVGTFVVGMSAKSSSFSGRKLVLIRAKGL